MVNVDCFLDLKVGPQEDDDLLLIEFCDNDHPYVEILSREIRNAGLEGKVINLHIIDNSELYGNYKPNAVGYVHKAEDGVSYNIFLFPERIEQCKDQDVTYVIRHELAHIKFGDLDSNLKGEWKKRYNKVVEDPRAHEYARGILN